MDAHARSVKRWPSVLASVGAVLAGSAGCDRSTPADGDPAVVSSTASVSSPEEVALRLGVDPSVVRRALRASPVPSPPGDPTNRVADDEEAVEFGRSLFFDPGLSGGGEVSCATCHRPELHFTDGLPLSKGVATAGRHAPTLVDAAHQRWFNWDGRSDSMWGHSIRPSTLCIIL